jgi:hypothetical protein
MLTPCSICAIIRICWHSPNQVLEIAAQMSHQSRESGRFTTWKSRLCKDVPTSAPTRGRASAVLIVEAHALRIRQWS